VNDALAIHRDLLTRGVAHEIVRLRRVILSADDLPDALDLPAERCVAVRMYEADHRLAAACVPAGATVAPSALLAATGARRIGIAPVDRINQDTQFAAGLVSPVLLPESVWLFLDSTLASAEVLYTATGESGTALGIHTADLLKLTRARVGPLLASVTLGTPASADPLTLAADPLEMPGALLPPHR